MISGDLFYKRLNDLKREIRYLKTAHFKTATTINTMTLNQTVNFSLTLDGLSGNIFSTQRAIITLTTDDSSEMVSACYLNNMTPSNLDDRFIFIKRVASNAGQVKYDVAVFSQNANDYNTLYGGGSVNLSYSLQAVGSSKFSISVEYHNILGGS
jgi:hypothetical protein